MDGRGARLARVSGRRAARMLAGAIALLAVLPGVASAHPLGNFTINHFAGIRVSATGVSLDVVIDEAEIPTVSERQRIDANGDGQLSPAEIERERQSACALLSTQLDLAVDGRRVDLAVAAAGLSFPPGAAGLPTMRLVCEYAGALPAALTASATVHFADASSADRIGWREIVVTGDGVAIAGAASGAASVSERLTHYPQGLLKAPLSMGELRFTVAPGGPAAEAPCIPDAFPVTAVAASSELGFGCAAAPGAAVVSSAAAVPGGVAGELSGLLSGTDLTPPALILSLLTALGLGAAHALTPGHGKTVMAAYLIGTRGTARHALALGLTVTVSHTIGVFALAAVILAVRIVTPDAYNHAVSVAAGLIVVAIGGWLLVGQVQRLRRRRLSGLRGSGHADTHDHDHRAGEASRHADSEHDDAAAPNGRRGEDRHGQAPLARGPEWHAHGGVSHRHAPVGDAPLAWRTLFALGLFGGLVPSVNALIILLATLATGRALYGLVLVVAFGAGMAIVLGGVGIGLVYASRWMDRSADRAPTLGRLVGWAPTVTSVVILVIGLVVTGQAIAGTPTL